MNMTISFTNSDIFEKQKFSLHESAGAESKTEDFAALFSVPVVVQPINAPIKIVKPENPGEIETDVQLIESNQNLPETDSSIKPLFTPKNTAQEPNFMQPNIEIKEFTGTRLSTDKLFPRSSDREFVKRNWEPTVKIKNLKNDGFTSALYEAAPLLSKKTFLAETESASTQISHFSLVFSQEEPLNDMPKLFNDFPNTVKTGNFNPKNAVETNVNVQPLESNQNSSEKNSQIKPDFLQTTNDSQMQNLTQPKNETFSYTKFTESSLTVENLPKPNFVEEISNPNRVVTKDFGLQIFTGRQSITNVEFTTSLSSELASSLSGQNFLAQIRAVNAEIKQFSSEINQEKISNNVQKLFDEISNVVKANNFKPENTGEIKAGTTLVESNQDLPEADSLVKPLFSPANIRQKPDFIALSHEASPDTNFTEAGLTTENQADFATGRKISEQIKPIVSSENRQNIPAQTQVENVEVNQFLPKMAQEKVPSAVPKLFNDISNVVKADNSIKTNSTPDLMTEQKIVEQIKQNISGESGQNLNQSETESPKNGKEFKVREISSGQIFDNFLNPVSKEQKIVENVPQTNNLNGKVFEQIEPRILELAAFNRNGGEKQILKMRLNPDELGAVEITLEKSSTGKINAHFQTESEATRQILNESLNQLRDSLQNSGWQVGDLEISCNSSSSNGRERRENQSQQFGTTENQPVETTNSDGNLKGEDDKQSRLVNLRA